MRIYIHRQCTRLPDCYIGGVFPFVPIWFLHTAPLPRFALGSGCRASRAREPGFLSVEIGAAVLSLAGHAAVVMAITSAPALSLPR